MFTGIIQAVGEVVHWDGQLLKVDAKELDLDALSIGESISNSGVCLTVIEYSGRVLNFELSEETVQKTNFKDCQIGQALNLERALKFSDRLGGHLVQGHVDGTSTVKEICHRENESIIKIQAPNSRYLVEKGSVTLDGVSLTVVNLSEDHFDLWIIPHTLQKTNIGRWKEGSLVNIEFDLILKYVAKLHASSTASVS